MIDDRYINNLPKNGDAMFVPLEGGTNMAAVK